MHVSTAHAGRTQRPAFAVVLAVLLLLALVPGTAGAAGTGGIEVTPDPPVVDGKTQTNFKVAVPSDGEERVPFTVRNTTDEQRSARLYVAEVTRPDGEALQLGSAGSSEVAALESQTVTLEPGEVQRMHFTVQGQELPGDEVLAAVVVEVGSGSIVQRAATLIYLRPGRQVPLPLLILGVAVVLLALAGGGVAVAARRRRDASTLVEEQTTGA